MRRLDNVGWQVEGFIIRLIPLGIRYEIGNNSVPDGTGFPLLIDLFYPHLVPNGTIQKALRQVCTKAGSG